jgi:NAD(P)-dependent dehydrogenase (short-subunit alcohol dehydrogenase family)
MSAERSVLVTGSSSGIGLGLAREFHARGWNVTAALRYPARFPPELAGPRVVALDLADQEQILGVAAQFDTLHCLVNNAGYGLTGPFGSYTPEQMRDQMQVNMLGPALLTQALLPALKRVGGRVINVSSIAGELGMPMNAMYCASKFALEGLSESLRHELAEAAVQVALVEPGSFRTRFAANMKWGARTPAPGSVEARQLAAYRAMQSRMLAREGRNPAPVVEAIANLAAMKSMPPRTRVGGDVRAVRLLERALPERLFLKIIGGLLRRRMAPGDEP